MASRQLYACHFCGRKNFKSQKGLKQHLNCNTICSQRAREQRLKEAAFDDVQSGTVPSANLDQKWMQIASQKGLKMARIGTKRKQLGTETTGLETDHEPLQKTAHVEESDLLSDSSPFFFNDDSDLDTDSAEEDDKSSSNLNRNALALFRNM